MVHITADFLRSKAEHNRGDLASLEEVSLHQLEIEGINGTLGRLTKQLKILYLQNNLIPRLQNLTRLRALEYLNVALNNVRRVEGLQGCEKLEKLDLTINFVDVDALEDSVEHLRPLERLRLLYLTGNPCTAFEGYRAFVVARLPQLESLDGQAVTRAERITARQREREVTEALREAAREQRRQRAAEEKEREEDRAIFGECASDNDDEDDDGEESAFTPEARLKAFRREQAKKEREAAAEKAAERRRLEETDPWAAAQADLAKRVEAPEDGSLPRQRNVGRTEFTLSEEDPERLLVDVAVPRFLDTSLIDVDVHPGWIQVVFKANNLLLHLPCEVSPDRSRVRRLPHNGHLSLELARMRPLSSEGVIRPKRQQEKRGRPAPAAAAAQKARRPATRGDEGLNADVSELMSGLREVSVRRSERLEGEIRAAEESRAAEAARVSAELSIDFDESEVPPLE